MQSPEGLENTPFKTNFLFFGMYIVYGLNFYLETIGVC